MAPKRGGKVKYGEQGGGRREIPAGEFKAKCLALMDRVRERREEYVITKHGKAVAKLVPVSEEHDTPKSAYGCLKGTVLWYGDIISPVAEEDWEVLQDDEGEPRDHD